MWKSGSLPADCLMASGNVLTASAEKASPLSLLLCITSDEPNLHFGSLTWLQGKWNSYLIVASVVIKIKLLVIFSICSILLFDLNYKGRSLVIVERIKSRAQCVSACSTVN